MKFSKFLILVFTSFYTQCVYAENVAKESSFPYANNPFLNQLDTTKPVIPIGPPHHIVSKHTLNQYQVAVLLPGGKDGEPPSYANVQGIPHAGGIWINLPGNYYDQRGPYRPPPGVYQPPIQNPPTQPPTTTTTVTYPPSTTYKAYTTTQAPTTTTYRPPYTQVVTIGTTPDPNLLLKYCLRPVGQFPSRFCNKFVNCWDGNAIEQFCPPTLVFNPKGYCDYDYNVDCQGRPIEAFPTEAPQHGGGKWPSDGSYVPPPPPPSDGGNYYPVTTLRPTYGPIIEPITLPSYPVSVAPPLILPQPNPSLKKYCLKPRGQFPGTRCNKYVNCWDDVVIEEQCPDGLVFNGAKGWCDFPENVRCYDRVDEPYPFVRGPTEQQEQRCPLSDGLFRNNHDCSKYYSCINGQVSEKYDCPTGYVFNDLIGLCDYPHRVDCTKEPIAYYPLNVDTNILQKVPADLYNPQSTCQPGTVIRLDPECYSAAICRSGTTEVIQCPQGLSYDSVTDKCVAPHLAKC